MSQPGNEGPVRVRLYGLLSMTRRRYLAQLGVAFALAAGLLAFWWFYWPWMRRGLRDDPSPVAGHILAFWDVAPWVIGGLSVAQAVEAFFVLRAFRRKEAEAKKEEKS